MKYLSLFLSLIAVAGCQIDVLDPVRGKALVPDSQAKIARKLYLDTKDERTVRAEERYIYNANGQLERIERLGYDTKGTGRMYSYDRYTYNSAGQPAQIANFSQTSSTTTLFQPTQRREFSYPATNQIVEQVLYNNLSVYGGSWSLVSRLVTQTENGRPLRKDRYGINAQQTLILQGTERYQYDTDRLLAVEYLDGTGKLFSTSRYAYKGRTATVETVYPTSTAGHVTQSLLYDTRGRLVQQRFINSGFDYASSSLSVGYSVIAFEYID